MRLESVLNAHDSIMSEMFENKELILPKNMLSLILKITINKTEKVKKIFFFLKRCKREGSSNKTNIYIG